MSTDSDDRPFPAADSRDRSARGEPDARGEQGRSSGAPLPPPPYRATPPPSAPFPGAPLDGTPDDGAPGDGARPDGRRPDVPKSAGRVRDVHAFPLPAPPPGPGGMRPLPPLPPLAARRRFVPVADDTQVMSALPPVPRAPGETDEDAELREGAPGASGGILRVAGAMAVATLVSRITGLLRTMVLTAAIGTGLVGDAYNVANTLPNIVYELLLGGVLTSVVVPLLVRAQDRDRDGGIAYAQRLATLAIAGLTVATVVAVLAAPLLTSLYGISGDPAQVRLANWLARLLLIEIVFYGVGALAQAILNSRDVFGPPAWAPVLNNVVVIATGALFLAASGPGDLTPVSITANEVWLLGIGTTLGIAVQALVLVPSLRKAGVPLRPRWQFKNTGLGEAGSLGLWVIAYVAISQVGVTVATRVGNEAARRHGLGSFAFANTSLLFQMPYGIIGVALLTALLPRMSRAASRHDVAGVAQDLSLGTRLSALGLLPVTAALMVLGPYLGILFFARGQVAAADAQAMGTALAIGAFGLLPMAVTLLQLRVFYSMKDARTPTLIQLGMVVVRVPLLLLVPVMVQPRHVVAGLMLVTSLTYVVGWVLGDVALRSRLGTLRTGEALPDLARIAAASATAGVAAWLVVRVIGNLVGAGTAGSLVTVVIGTVVTGAVALAGLSVARVPELAEPLAAVRARVGRR